VRDTEREGDKERERNRGREERGRERVCEREKRRESESVCGRNIKRERARVFLLVARCPIGERDGERERGGESAREKGR